MTDEPHNSNPSSTPDLRPQDAWRKHIHHAMQVGIYIGLSFALTAVSWFFFHTPLIQGLLALAGFIGVPTLMILGAIKYRDQVLDGHIPYLRAVGFMTWSYLFGMIISLLSFYIVFTVLFHNPEFMRTFEDSIGLFLQMVQDTGMRENYEKAMSGLTPRIIALNLATSQLFFGLIFMYIAALFVRR